MAEGSITQSYKSLDHTDKDVTTIQRTLPGVDSRSRGSRPSLIQKNHARMIQACHALAIDPKEMKMKKPEEVWSPDDPEQLKQMKYLHYQKRYRKMMRDINQKEKEIRAKEMDQFNKNYFDKIAADDSMAGDGVLITRKPIRSQSVAKTQRSKVLSGSPRDSVSMQGSRQSDSIEKVVQRYRNKLSRVRKSWDENTKSLNRSQENADPQELLDAALDEKMVQINRAIEQSEKYSQYVIDMHLKRKKLFESILRRDIRKEVLKRNSESQRSKNIHEKIEDYNSKRERAFEVEKQFNKKLKEDEKTMTEKFKKIEKRLEEIELDRRRQYELKEKMSKERFEIIHVNKEKEYEKITQKIQENYQKFMERQAEGAENVQNKMFERVRVIKDNVRKFEENWGKAKTRRTEMDENSFQRSISVLIKKEKETENIRIRKEKELEKKMKETRARVSQSLENYKEVELNRKKWTKDLENKFKRSEELLKLHKEKQEFEMRMRHELTMLKKNDQEENLERLTTLRLQREQEILDRERLNALKLDILHKQNNILNEARVVVAKTAKTEREKILSELHRNKVFSEKMPTLEETSKQIELEKKLEQKRKEEEAQNRR